MSEEIKKLAERIYNKYKDTWIIFKSEEIKLFKINDKYMYRNRKSGLMKDISIMQLLSFYSSTYKHIL